MLTVICSDSKVAGAMGQRIDEKGDVAFQRLAYPRRAWQRTRLGARRGRRERSGGDGGVVEAIRGVAGLRLGDWVDGWDGGQKDDEAEGRGEAERRIRGGNRGRRAFNRR